MSRFIDAIRHRLTGNKDYIIRPLSITYTPIIEDHLYTEEYVYEVVWRTLAKCTRRDLSHMHESVIRQLREDVYGDLRDRLIRLERAVLEYDREQTLQEIRDLVQEIMHK